MSDKSTKIYKRVVLSHKVKEIWSYYGVGRGGVREPANFFPVRNTTEMLSLLASCIEIICSARLNIITGIDFVSRGSQKNCPSLKQDVCIYSLWDNVMAANQCQSVTWKKRTFI